MKLSIILPIFNDINNTKSNFPKIKKAAEKFTKDFEIILAEDGSTDGTNEYCRTLAKKYKNVYHSTSKKKLGRGKALNKAFKKAKGKSLVYMDIDLATDIKYLPTLIKELESGTDFVTGSRYAKGSNIKRHLRREIVIRIYNTLIRILFNSPIKDHQCGFKGFKKSCLMRFIDKIEDNGWFWDTECFLRANNLGYSGKEIPVKWRCQPSTTVQVTEDSINMGTRMLQLWMKLKKEK